VIVARVISQIISQIANNYKVATCHRSIGGINGIESMIRSRSRRDSHIYPAFLAAVLFPITGRRGESRDRTGQQVARAGRLKSLRRAPRELIRTVSAVIGRHQRVARTRARMTARDLQQARALARVLRANVSMIELSAAANFAATTRLRVLRLVAAGLRVDAKVGELKVLLIHLEIRLAPEAAIHPDRPLDAIVDLLHGPIRASPSRDETAAIHPRRVP